MPLFDVTIESTTVWKFFDLEADSETAAEVRAMNLYSAGSADDEYVSDVQVTDVVEVGD